MEPRIQTLHTIYNLVKGNPQPTESFLQSSELILRQNCPWDEVVKNLNELRSEGLVITKQLATMVISITEKGLTYMNTCFCHACENRRAVA